MPEHAVCVEEHQRLHVRKEQLVLQGEEGDAILKIEIIGCLFSSASMVCKGSKMVGSYDEE